MGYFFKFRKLMGHWPLPTLKPKFIHEKTVPVSSIFHAAPTFHFPSSCLPLVFKGNSCFFFSNVFLNEIPSLPDQRRWSSPKKSCEIQNICRQTIPGLSFNLLKDIKEGDVSWFCLFSHDERMRLADASGFIIYECRIQMALFRPTSMSNPNVIFAVATKG